MAKQPALPVLIKRWEAAKATLDQAKVDELALRNAIITTAVPAPVEGTNTLDLGTLKVKVTHVLNYSFDQATLADAMRRLPAQVAAKLVKYRPELDKATYRTLGAPELLILSDTLSIKAGQSQLEIVRPKTPTK